MLRETCDRVLEDPAVPRAKAQLRAVALQILGEAYMAVRKDADEAQEDLEDVVGFGHVGAEEALALGGGTDVGVEGPGVEDRPDGGGLRRCG